MSRSRRGGWLALVALVLPVALAAALWVWQSREVERAEAALAEDRAAVSAATLETLAWASVDHQKVDEFVARVQQGATGEFLQQFRQSETALRALLRRNKSVQVPAIPKDGAALLERRGDEARVLIVMDADVTNVSTSTPQPRQYRLQVTMTEVDGRWLTSALEIIGATT